MVRKKIILYGLCIGVFSGLFFFNTQTTQVPLKMIAGLKKTAAVTATALMFAGGCYGTYCAIVEAIREEGFFKNSLNCLGVFAGACCFAGSIWMVILTCSLPSA